MNMKIHKLSVQAKAKSHSGFTLTEMLVAVGLLLTIMVIFAQIFQLAVTAMTSQKGMANNDQRARTAFTVLDADLKKMSYRSIPGYEGIVPLVPGLQYNGELAAAEQQGYFYYSENDPSIDTDDVLQFTIDATVPGNFNGASRYAQQSELPFYGKANSIDVTGRRDQPDWDDGTFGDGVARSTQAEVVYFLRHGTLYRRVLLLRDTNDGVPGNMEQFDASKPSKLAQPGYPVTVGMDEEPFDMMRSYTGNFYSDFDYSAHYGISPYDDDLTTPTGLSVACFHSSLSNDPTNNWPLGVPHFRFGFSPTSGRPREYIAINADPPDQTNTAFIGRYTHEETSNAGFLYPQATGGNIYGRTDFNLSTLRSTGRLNVFADGFRRGADILLNNVHSFDVEIWDDLANGGVGGFVDINGANASNFLLTNRTNSSYAPINGPSIVNQGIFDTWHSIFDIANPTGLSLTQIGNGQPPFVPKNISSASIVAWQENTAYVVGDLIRPSSAFISNAANSYSRINDAIFYECISAGYSAELPVDEPNWSRDVTNASPITETDTQEDPPLSGLFRTPAQWRLVENRKPIVAIRLTVRFLDPTSNQMRQMSMIHSFNEDGI